MARQIRGKSTNKLQHFDSKGLQKSEKADVYDDLKLDDEHDPGAYLGDQFIMLEDEHPEGPWKE